ncbi:hypothetical protein [Chitinophaga caseinilytica]|uniref:Uncharacterized protein n=1 Tax=Chitinophaga caseinilytica TaxID=2267521 RepID=A0ABZ2ZB61_9BACT
MSYEKIDRENCLKGEISKRNIFFHASPLTPRFSLYLNTTAVVGGQHADFSVLPGLTPGKPIRRPFNVHVPKCQRRALRAPAAGYRKPKYPAEDKQMNGPVVRIGLK